jgi:hypothetical protein
MKDLGKTVSDGLVFHIVSMVLTLNIVHFMECCLLDCNAESFQTLTNFSVYFPLLTPVPA